MTRENLKLTKSKILNFDGPQLNRYIYLMSLAEQRDSKLLVGVDHAIIKMDGDNGNP